MWGEATAAPLRQGEPASLQLKGRLEPRRFVELSVSQPGRIESVLVAEGDRVAAGDLLARLDGYESLSAEVDRARLELVLAQQALDELERAADVQLAEATLALRQAEKDVSFAEDHLAGLQRPTPVMDVQAANANLLLAEKRLAKARKELRIARHLYDDHNDIAWYFINRGPYRQYLAALEKIVAYAERRYWDLKEKVDELGKPPDEIDVQVAAGELATAQARQREAARQVEELAAGPDPDELAAVETRLEAAKACLAAARAARRDVELRAPISGEVVDLPVKHGEWVRPAQPLAVIADLSDWAVQVDDLGENLAAELEPSQAVAVSLDAYQGSSCRAWWKASADTPAKRRGRSITRRALPWGLSICPSVGG